jgi:hypothetical protein
MIFDDVKYFLIFSEKRKNAENSPTIELYGKMIRLKRNKWIK